MCKKTLLIAGAVIALVAVMAVCGWAAEFECFLKFAKVENASGGSQQLVLHFANLPVASKSTTDAFLKVNQQDILTNAADLCRGMRGVQDVQINKSAGTVTLLLTPTLSHEEINTLANAITQKLSPLGGKFSWVTPEAWSWGEGTR